MIEKLFYNVFILGTIISFCILPILLFLNKNKYKYTSKKIYKLFLIVLLLLFLPINTLNFSKIKDNFMQISQTSNAVISTKTLDNNFDTTYSASTIVENNNSINLQNDTLFNIFKSLPYLWFSIFMLILAYHIVTYLLFLHSLKSACVVTDKINFEIEKISENINLKKKVLCYTSQKITSPMSLGIFKPKIIVPVDISEYEAILKHELFHIKNKDILCKFLLLLLNCIYWFNPIIYNFQTQFDEIIELNCDENVLENQNETYRLHYAQILLNQIEKNRAKKYVFSTNFVNRRKNIMNRFSNIVNNDKKKSAISLATILTILLIIALTIIICIPNINFATIEPLQEENLIDDTDKVPNDNEIPDENNQENINFVLPLDNCKLTVPFYEGTHYGIDLVETSGTPIYACADGTVTFAGYDGERGNIVRIEHANSIETSYSQCSILNVKAGETVKTGDIIAKVGSTGNSTGPHLHFEMRQNGTIINPETYISFE